MTQEALAPFDEQQIFESAGFIDAATPIPHAGPAIVFVDKRMQAGTVSWLPPLTSIAQVEAFSVHGSERGTGWFLTPQIVITAAHLLYPDPGGNPVAHAVITPGLNGPHVKPLGSPKSSMFAAPQGWLQNQDPRADFAAIKLPQPLGVNPFQPADLSDKELKEGQFILAGYPVDKAPGTMWGMEGPLLQGNKFVVHHKIAVRHGQSGGPLFRWIGGDQQVIGIQSGSDNFNRAIRIHADVLKLFKQWAT
jgi:glutamyl endopeptidase